MRLNPQCMRDILLVVENKPFPEHYSMLKLKSFLPGYSDEEIYYTCLKLWEGNLLQLSTIGTGKKDYEQISTVDDLTYDGHQFLEKIRNEKIWKKTLSLAKNVGSFSVNLLGDIAVNVISEMLKTP